MGKENVLTGTCTITLASLPVGLTTEDGVSFGEERTWTEVKADQTLVTVHKRLQHIRRTLTFSLLEITAAFLEKCGGYTLDGTNKIKYTHIQTVLDCVISGPAADGKILTYTTEVLAVELGDVVRTKTGEVALAVTLEEVGDPSDNTFGVYGEA